MYNPSLNRSGKPQEFKGIYFYPLRLKDEEYHDILTSILSYNKNTISDVKILKMSYFKFILMCLSGAYKDSFDIGSKLEEILSYITKTNVVFMYRQLSDEPDEYLSNIEFYAMFDDIEVSEWEFESVREILLEQNGTTMKFVNEYDKTLEEHLKFVHRKNKSANFEEQLFSYCAYMRLPVDVVEETHTFYQFQKMMNRIRLLLNFELYKPLEVSGQITLKEGTIDDWLSHIPERGRYDDILIKKESFVKDNDIFKVSQTK